MTPSHDPRHEEWLRDALAAGPGANLAPPDDCELCRQQLEALRRVENVLHDAAEEQRALLASLDRSGRAPGTAAVAEFVRARAQERPARPAPRPFRRGVWIAAAAAALVAGAWTVHLTLSRAPADAPVALGAELDGRLQPQGSVERYGPLSWDLPLAEGQSYELTVFDARPGSAAAPVLPPTRLSLQRWEGDTSAWPERIRWQLRILDATGVELGTWAAECSRKSSR